MLVNVTLFPRRAVAGTDGSPLSSWRKPNSKPNNRPSAETSGKRSEILKGGVGSLGSGLINWPKFDADFGINHITFRIIFRHLFGIGADQLLFGERGHEPIVWCGRKLAGKRRFKSPQYENPSDRTHFRQNFCEYIKANVLALLLLPASLAEAQETTWDWTVAPYLWASSVGLDLAVTDGPSIGGGAEFKDLLDKVDTVFMGRLEARKGAWGMYLDSIDIQTGPSETDVMLGARAIGRFAQRWHWALRGDLSFGGSEGAYNGLASFGYTFGESDLFTMTLGYRYMSI